MKEISKALKLKRIVECMDMGDIGGQYGDGLIVAATNVDDIFRVLREKRIKEVRVDFREMYMIIMFMLANIGGKREGAEKWEALKIMQEGKVNKFLGVKLHLND